MKAKVTPDGLGATPVNPYPFRPAGVFESLDDETFASNKQHVEFNQAYPTRPLTKPMEPNSEIEVEEVWQLFDHDGEEWQDGNKPGACSWEDFNRMWRTTRIAYQPLPSAQPLEEGEKEPDFLEWCKQERINFSNGMLRDFDWFELTSNQRVIAENFIICFDQLLDRYKEQQQRSIAPLVEKDAYLKQLEAIINTQEQLIETLKNK